MLALTTLGLAVPVLRVKLPDSNGFDSESPAQRNDAEWGSVALPHLLSRDRRGCSRDGG